MTKAATQEHSFIIDNIKLNFVQ